MLILLCCRYILPPKKKFMCRSIDKLFQDPFVDECMKQDFSTFTMCLLPIVIVYCLLFIVHCLLSVFIAYCSIEIIFSVLTAYPFSSFIEAVDEQFQLLLGDKCMEYNITLVLLILVLIVFAALKNELEYKKTV